MNVVDFQHAGGQSSSLLDNKTLRSTFLGQMDYIIAARNSNKSNASKDSETLQKSSSIVLSAEETLRSRPLRASKKRDLKNLVQDSDDNSTSRRADHSSDNVLFLFDKDSDDASCGTRKIDHFGRGVEAAVGVIISGSQGLGYDNEDRNLEFKKHSGILEASNQELISSSDDKCDDGDEKMFKSNKRDESDQIHAPPVSTSLESDVEEEDVKVCDICGDAGREDLLAICSKCSDGAEHTYCMREKLDKVPEGDWVCEECKCNELLEAQKVEHSKKRGSKSLGRTNSLVSDLSLKLDKDPFCERPKLRNISLNRQASSKRFGERMESCPTTKKQALESPMGSPTTTSPNRSRMGVLSKNGSSKNLDNMGRSNNQTSTGTESTGDSSENARSPTENSPHALKGNFLKSNSFSSSNSKQNVKVSDDVLQKQGNDPKDGIGKLIGKSMSFKGLGRSSSVEPRVKMLPAKCAPVQDLKCHKHGRDHFLSERKNTIKLDHSLPGHTKLPRGMDGNSTLSATITHNYKNVQTDVKLPNMSKHAAHLDQKSSDVMMNIGIVGSTSVNGTSNAFETKLNDCNVNDGSMMSSSRTADGSLNANGVRADGQDSQSEKAPENCSSHSRQSLNSGTVSGSRKLPLDASALKTKDGVHEENKLKAAIEAAMQKKQDIFKKNKIPVKPNDFPIPNTQRYHREDAVSNEVRDFMSEEAMHVGNMDLHHDINLNSSKQMPISGTKQMKLYPADFENSSVRESVLTVSAIPEQESVWQGGFEIHRNGKLADIRGGFQAHMSRFASCKVLEVVGKLPQKIIFNEVPRPCAWPVQFKELGAQEDNIALYFFAKDTESYMRSYKILVDYMMKHDLALKGNINGVELLVFPSNHLPHKSKCWNALYFIWGVVRSRRQRFPDNRFDCLGKREFSISGEVVPDEDVILAENPCLHKPVADQFSISDNGHNFVSGCEAPVIAVSSLQQLASLSNGYRQKEECSVSGTCVNSPNGTGNHEKRPRNLYTSLGEVCPESESAALRDHCQENLNRSRKHQKSTRDLDRGKNLPAELMLDKFLPSKLPVVGKQEGDTIVSSVNSQLLDTGSDCISNVKFDNSVKQEKPCLDNVQKNGKMKLEDNIDQREDMNYLLKNGVKLKSEGSLRADDYVDTNVSAYSNVDDLHRLQDSRDRQSHEDSIGAISLGAASITCQKRPWVDTRDTSENGDLASHGKNMKGFDSFSGCTIYGCPSFGERKDAQMGGVSSCSRKADTSYEAGNEKPIATNPASGKGCSFLVDSHPVHNIEPGDGFLSSEVALLENEDRLLGGSPNLELALGVKKKQGREGFLPFLTGVNRKDPDEPPDIVGSSKEEDEDASASLSLSLGFPFSDKERMPRPERPSSTAEQTISTRHEINAPLLLFRGSSSK